MTVTAIETEEFKMTEIGLLPREWEVVRLGDVAKVSSGGSAPQGKDFFGGQNPFIRVQHLELESDTIRRWDLITDEAVNKYGLRLYSKGTIVFPKSGASIYLEKRAILPIDAYIVSHLCAVISRSSLIDQNFLFYYLRFVRFSEQKAEGYPTINLTEIKERRIAWPPFSEQKSIAYFLSTVQTAIEKTEAVIKATRELKKSLMKHLFTYGPVSIGEAENVPLKETEIGMVPEHWQQTELGQIADIVYGVQAAVANLTDSSIGIPILTNINVRNEGMLDISTLRYYPLPENKRDKLILKKGDVLFNWRSGSPLHVGKTAIFNLDGDYTFSSFILRFRSCADSVSNEYLFRYLNLLKSYGFFLSKRSQSSVNSVFNASLAAKIPILLPSTLDQIKISSMLSSADRNIEAEENKKRALEALFKTLLSNLMTGKIRVNNLEVPV